MNEEGRLTRLSEISYQDRRRKADWVVNAASVLSIVSWLFALVVWGILEFASPERETVFTQSWDIGVRTWWDGNLLPLAFVLLVMSFITCIVAFLFNMTRMRRKTDKYRMSIIIIGIITFIGIIAFVIRFGSYLI